MRLPDPTKHLNPNANCDCKTGCGGVGEISLEMGKPQTIGAWLKAWITKLDQEDD
jgi:hypothetical protein